MADMSLAGFAPAGARPVTSMDQCNACAGFFRPSEEKISVEGQGWWCTSCAAVCTSCQRLVVREMMTYMGCANCDRCWCADCCDEVGGSECDGCGVLVCNDPDCSEALPMDSCSSCGTLMCCRCQGRSVAVASLEVPPRDLPHLQATRLPTLERNAFAAIK